MARPVAKVKSSRIDLSMEVASLEVLARMRVSSVYIGG